MNKKRLIITSLFSVIGLLSLSVSFSIAWYASSTRLAVRTIKIEIDDDRELKISTSPELDTFKSSLVEGIDDLYDVGLYKPVSSMLSYTWMDEKKGMPEFRDSSSVEQIHGAPIPEVWDNGFYRQELWLLADDDVYVTVDNTKTTFEPDVAANREAVQALKNKPTFQTYNDGEILESLNNLKYSLRFSILQPDLDNYKYQIVDPYKSGETLLGGLLDNMNDGYYDTYTGDDGETYEIVYGEVYNRDKIVYDNPTNIDIEPSGEYNAFNAKTKGSAHHFNYEASKDNGFYFKTEETLSMDDLEGLDSKIRIPLERGVPKKIVLSIYLEGWDRDNINNTMGANFISNVTFKILREIVK